MNLKPTRLVTIWILMFQMPSESLPTGSCAAVGADRYFSFAARGAFSATYFTLLGNVCKLLTIVLNNLVSGACGA